MRRTQRAEWCQWATAGTDSHLVVARRRGRRSARARRLARRPLICLGFWQEAPAAISAHGANCRAGSGTYDRPPAMLLSGSRHRGCRPDPGHDRSRPSPSLHQTAPGHEGLRHAATIGAGGPCSRSCSAARAWRTRMSASESRGQATDQTRSRASRGLVARRILTLGIHLDPPGLACRVAEPVLSFCRQRAVRTVIVLYSTNTYAACATAADVPILRSPSRSVAETRNVGAAIQMRCITSASLRATATTARL